MSDQVASSTQDGLIDKYRVADRWSDTQVNEEFSPNVYWMANPTVYHRYHEKAVRGQPYDHWIRYCLHFLGCRTPAERMLSIGCGNGQLERSVAACHGFKACDAFDVAPGAVEEAKRRATEAGIVGINYAVRDAESTCLPENLYDAAWFNSSLHHISNLEHVLANVARALKPDGYLFVHEYIGPNRFALSAREKEVLRCAFQLIPQKYRRSCAKANWGEIQEGVSMPDPAAVAALDPSESVRSADICKVLSQFFTVAEFNACGGTILQFLLHKIMGNFQEEDADSMKVLRMLFKMEDTLLEIGDIQTHFALIVARPKLT
jgi:ubiquinone/menaquinone biosynthesis C-methylase UbiE